MLSAQRTGRKFSLCAFYYALSADSMNLFSYLQEVKSEMSRVTWPNRKQVLDLTALVIAISIIVGVYVGGLDFVFTNVLNKILGR